MGFETAENHSFTAQLDCRYLLALPDDPDERSVLAVALHGYGANPEVMLRLTGAMLGPRHAVASLQAPSQFYLSGHPESEIGYSWATRQGFASSVRLHHEMVLRVLDEAGSRCGIPSERRMLIGFSQPVGLNYRFAATHPEAVRGIIGICGGVPGDWEKGNYRKVSASLLHIARSEDEFYPTSVTEQYAARLGARAEDVEFHMLPGGHRFPSKAAPIIEPWVARVLG